MTAWPTDFAIMFIRRSVADAFHVSVDWLAVKGRRNGQHIPRRIAIGLASELLESSARQHIMRVFGCGVTTLDASRTTLYECEKMTEFADIIHRLRCELGRSIR